MTLAGHFMGTFCVDCVKPLLWLSLDYCWYFNKRHWPWIRSAMRTLHKYSRGSAVQGRTSWRKTHFSRALVTAKSTSWMCAFGRRLGGASMLSEAGYLVCWLWGLPEDASKGSHWLFPARPVSTSYKVIGRWLLLVLDLKVNERGQAENHSWVPLVLGLGPLSMSEPDIHYLGFVNCSENLESPKNNQDRPFVWKGHWKWLGWACNFGGAGLRESSGQGEQWQPGWCRLRYGAFLLVLCGGEMSERQQ